MPHKTKTILCCAQCALRKNEKNCFLRLFWKGFSENRALSISMRKSWRKEHMLRDAKTNKFFGLARILFIAQNKKMSFDFFQNEFKRLFHTFFRDPNLILDERNLDQVWNNTWQSQLLSRLTERNHGLTLGGILVCSALEALQHWNLDFWRTKGSSTEIKIKIDFFSSLFSLGLVITWDIRTNWVLPIFSLLLPFSLVLPRVQNYFWERDVLPTCPPKKIIFEWNTKKLSHFKVFPENNLSPGISLSLWYFTVRTFVCDTRKE